MQTATDEAQLGFVVDVVVKVRRVCPCRDEHDHQRVGLAAFLVTFLDPCADGSAVGRIAEYFLPPPNPVLARPARW